MEKLLGVVMCGGQSQRMGTDKGLILQGDTTWAQLIYSKLHSLNIPVIISVNQTQSEKYSEMFHADLITDTQNIPGPLNGILSVHDQHPNKDLLILACDMIDMDQSTLQKLISIYQSHPGYDYYAYHNGEFFEPLCAIYTGNALTNLQQTDLVNYSLQKVLRNANTKQLAISSPDAFKTEIPNLNSQYSLPPVAPNARPTGLNTNSPD